MWWMCMTAQVRHMLAAYTACRQCRRALLSEEASQEQKGSCTCAVRGCTSLPHDTTGASHRVACDCFGELLLTSRRYA